MLISSKYKKFIQRYARRKNKSISGFIDDLLASVKRPAGENNKVEDDKWIKKTAGSYTSGKKDVQAFVFKKGLEYQKKLK